MTHDWVIHHLDDAPQAVELLSRLAEDGIAISMITYMEVLQGRLRSPDPEAQAKFNAFLDSVPVIPFSAPVAERCARLRETLKEQGKRVNARALDLINAATALEHGLTLVTGNIADYDDIPDLDLYRQEQEP